MKNRYLFIWALLCCSYSCVFSQRDAYTTNRYKTDYSKFKSPNLRPAQDPKLLVSASIMGGGQISGNFSTGVLLALEQIKYTRSSSEFNDTSTVLNEIDMFATTSGGGQAAGSYLSYKAYLKQKAEENSKISYSDYFIRYASKNLRANLKIQQLINYFIPTFNSYRRSQNRILTNKYDRKFLNSGKLKSRLTLSDVFIRATSDTVPYLPLLVAHGSLMDGYVGFPLTPDIFEKFKTSGYLFPDRYHNLSRRIEYRHWALLKSNESITDFIYRMPLAVALKASASFPAILPHSTFRSLHPVNVAFLDSAFFPIAYSNSLMPQSNTLKSELPKANQAQSKFYIQDGGLSDNFSLYNAIDFMKYDSAPKKVHFVITNHSIDSNQFRLLNTYIKRHQILVPSVMVDLRKQNLTWEKRYAYNTAGLNIHKAHIGFLTLVENSSASKDTLNNILARSRSTKRVQIQNKRNLKNTFTIKYTPIWKKYLKNKDSITISSLYDSLKQDTNIHALRAYLYYKVSTLTLFSRVKRKQQLWLVCAGMLAVAIEEDNIMQCINAR